MRNEEGICSWKLAVEGGGMHALVDCACGAVVYAEVTALRVPAETLLAYVLCYNALAFGLQWLVGLLTDVRGVYRGMSVAGAWLVAAGAVVGPDGPWTGAVLAGLGNACFHVGVAGALLPRCGNQAGKSGLFVGPGAIGIFVGVWIGTQPLPWRELAVPLLALAGARLWFLVPTEMIKEAHPRRPHGRTWALVIIGALFVSVAIRGAVGGLLGGAWRTSVAAGLAVAVAACGGKCLGGWVADWFGWRRTAMFALILSAPLVLGGMHYLPLAILGMLLFQSTMAVTLMATHHVFPRAPAFAFGVPSLALLAGSLPGFTPFLVTYPQLSKVALIPLILVSAALLYFGIGPSGRGSEPTAKDERLTPIRSAEVIDAS